MLSCPFPRSCRQLLLLLAKELREDDSTHRPKIGLIIISTEFTGGSMPFIAGNFWGRKQVILTRKMIRTTDRTLVARL